MDVAANWAKLKQTVTYTESDSLAVVRTSENALSWLPVFLNDWSGAPHISIDGRMELVDAVAGFERYETLKTKKLFDTATLEHWFSFLVTVELARADLVCSLALAPSLLKRTAHRLLLNLDV